MDANISVFSIQDEFKFSEQVLKRLSTEDPNSPPKTECSSKSTKIREIPGVRYRMFLNFITKNNVSYFTLFFIFYKLNDRRIRGTFAFYIKSANYASQIKSKLFDYNSVGCYDFSCNIEDLFNPEKKFIVNGECCIEFKGVFYLESSIKRCEPKQTLAQYLWNCGDRDLTILVGKENDSKTEIKVHKCVLGARSPVFAAMFKTNMKEKAENKVQIIDFGVQTVKKAIAFCYDQEYESSDDDITDVASLFQFADKYDIQDLKNQTEQFCVTECTPENICEIANASIISNSPKLRDYCIQKMIMFSKMKFSIDNIEILDKDIASELLKKTFSFQK